jgi:hypothetical protein
MKRNIINTSVTDSAYGIYKALPPHRKGIYVSAALVEKHSHDTGTGLEARLEDIEKRLERLEGAKGK